MTNQVKLRPLGGSELLVSPLGLGCWQFSKGAGLVGRYWPVLDDTEIIEIVRSSLAGGINWLDTAESYGNGMSEQAVAKALSTLESEGIVHNDVYIATKWWPIGRTAKSITATIDERISALSGRRIDLYQIHQPYSFSSIEKEMAAMAELVKQKKIRYVGVSNYSAEQMRSAHQALQEYGLKLISNQVKYNLLDRTIELNGIMDAAKELGISIIAYSPLEQGILTGRFHKEGQSITGLRKLQRGFKPKGLSQSKPLIDLLASLADRYEATSSQVALNWLIHFHGETVVAIPGASKVKQAVENIGAMTFRLKDDELAELDHVSRSVSEEFATPTR